MLRDGAYDLVIKVHTRTSAKRIRRIIVRYFRRYQVENLLSSRRLRREPPRAVPARAGPRARLPADDPHRLRDAGQRLEPVSRAARSSCCEQARHPTSRSTASHRSRRSAACGSRRPEALRLLARCGLGVRRLRPSAVAKKRTTSRDVQERLVASAAGELGFHCRTVMNAEHAGDQPPVARVQGRSAVGDDAGLSGRADPVPPPRRLGRPRRHRRDRADVREPQPPRDARGRSPRDRPLGSVARRGIFALRAARGAARRRPARRRRTSMTDADVAAPPASFPADGRRLVVYVVWDRRGEVEDYIPYALAGLRDHATRILVVVNGRSSDERPREAGAGVADEILVRENVGFDIWAHKDALDHLGAAHRRVRRDRPDERHVVRPGAPVRAGVRADGRSARSTSGG